MMDFLWVLLFFTHMAALAGLALAYLRKAGLPRTEWPLALFLLFWAALVVTGYLVSLFDELHNLLAYVIVSFPALALVLWAHYLTCGLPFATPYARIAYPGFTVITSPKLRRFLWWFLLGTLGIALLVHVIIGLSFYPVNADSLNYRLARVPWYVSHGNLLHPFVSLDKRLTFYPVDGLLLYVPLVLYGVSAVFYSLPSLFAWLAVGYVSYRFARALQAERLIALFAAWLVAAMPSILVEASATNDEILTAAPFLLGLFFVWRWLLSGSGQYLFLASVGLGLCIGTKLHIFFLIPMAMLGAAWFAWFLWRRHESWRKYLPAFKSRDVVLSLIAVGWLGLMFLMLNLISSGNFYFLGETADQVLNTSAKVQGAVQNFAIYVSQMIFAPVADLNFWQSFHQREIANRALNNIIAPLIRPLVSDDPTLYHLKYRFQGVYIPTSVLLVEYSLWPGFAWMLWPLQVAGALRRKFSLRPLLIMIGAIPVMWLIIWSCVTLYMEGVPTYFAFYMMCSAPAMVLCFVRASTPRRNRIRWAVIAFVVLTNFVIDANVCVNNTFRGLWNLTLDRPRPYDWLLFEQPIVDEIKRAKRIQIPITHGKVYYFAFMHWNTKAIYYSPYEPAPDPQRVLHILSMPSEFSYGFMPMMIPFKASPGITYLGHIRGVDREQIFAFGDGVERRWPARSNFISFHLQFHPEGGAYQIETEKVVAGYNPLEDHLEFQFVVKTADDRIVYTRDWDSEAAFSAKVTHNPAPGYYMVAINVRSRLDHRQSTTSTFQIGGAGAWKMLRNGQEQPDDDDL